jgi:hypothetical protein
MRVNNFAERFMYYGGGILGTLLLIFLIVYFVRGV